MTCKVNFVRTVRKTMPHCTRPACRSRPFFLATITLRYIASWAQKGLDIESELDIIVFTAVVLHRKGLADARRSGSTIQTRRLKAQRDAQPASGRCDRSP